MLVSEFACLYVRQKRIESTPIYSAARFVRIVGDLPLDQVSKEHLEKFRDGCESSGYSAWTIKGSLKDMLTLIREYTGKKISVSAVRVPCPDPQPVPIEQIDLIWDHLAPWAQQWMAVSYWTAARLSDSISLQIAGFNGKQIRWKASKTGRIHQYPVPDWLKRFLFPVPLPYGKSLDHAGRIVRNELKRACEAAKTDVFQPNNVRDRSLTEWLKADASVGKIVHGCGLGVLDHYAGRMDLIQAASERLRLPSCFGASVDQTETLLRSFKRLDAASQKLISDTASKLAGS